MTNETIFYIIGLLLGLTLGYAIRSLRARKEIGRIAIHIKSDSNIVRCKECKYASNRKCEFHSKEGDELIVAPNDFCSAGKRRSDERS